MNRYKTIKALGDGTYGSVVKAVNRTTGESAHSGAAEPRIGRWQRSSLQGWLLAEPLLAWGRTVVTISRL